MKINSCVAVSIITLLYSPLLTPTASKAEQTAHPYLIVPGFSIGKMQLRQSQETVRQKMGQPAKSESRKCATVTYNNQTHRYDRKTIGELNVDVWRRPVSSQDKGRNLRNGCPNLFEVFYKDGRVVQITITLSGYKTKNNLSINSAFQEFEKYYGEPGEANKTWFDWDSERPFGSSHAQQSYWDFKKCGLAIESDTYSDGGDGPTAVFAISIHPPDQLYLFNTAA